ncbi:conserved hypothetical protein [Culex quinquefasciatus]|uniref:CRAL-TRIO domain-containing protein n=1 Tax=Culex quinquefasciatus TaxID=7176 RepID=B0XAY1_CULQU|nr:conserved hypothetical protein [Culex quinquefasciatus]|eukprot:XP_001866803.1 conserved hypothetical protein [Culex quinquefasciatus]
MASFTVQKCPQSYDEYKFTLDERHLQKARIDLNETQENRAQSLAQMRDWIAKHPHINKCRTDSTFLLRFLRMRKFSVPMAQESLERYLVTLRSFPQWFRNLDPLDGEIRLFNKAGVLTSLGRDSLGRTVILLRARAFNPERFTSAHFVRQIMLLLETTIEEEESQINGYVVIADYEAISLKQLSVWSLNDVSNASDSLFQSFPLRIQEIHAIRVPRFFEMVSDLALSCMSEKIRNRVTVLNLPMYSEIMPHSSAELHSTSSSWLHRLGSHCFLGFFLRGEGDPSIFRPGGFFLPLDDMYI